MHDPVAAVRMRNPAGAKNRKGESPVVAGNATFQVAAAMTTGVNAGAGLCGGRLAPHSASRPVCAEEERTS